MIHLTREMLSTEALCGHHVPADAPAIAVLGAVRSGHASRNHCGECLAKLSGLPASHISAFEVEDEIETIAKVA